MKLRILDNSLRVRLSRGEVDHLKDSGLVTASTAFPGSRSLNYRVESSPASVKAEAFFSDSEVTVRLPETDVRAWASSDQISMASEQQLDDGQILKVLVEKDFACLQPRDGEDESDLFPHPQAGQETC